MPIKFDINYPLNLTIFTLTGDLTYEDLKDILYPYLKAGSTRFRLYDFSECTVNKSILKEVDRIVEWVDKNFTSYPPDSKITLVVKKDADYEMLRALHLLTKIKSKTWEARVFYSRLEAFEWLDLPPATS